MDKYIHLLFDRPFEPLFIPKGEEGVNFELPTEHISDNYQASAVSLQSRFGNDASDSVKIPKVEIPDMTIPLSLDRKANFSVLIPAHRDIAAYLTDVFLKLPTVADLLYVAASIRDRLNPQLFVYSLSVALLHRPDTKNLKIPQLIEIFPDKFINSEALNRAREDASILPTGSRVPLEIPLDFTASDKDPEHVVAYFREDIGVNLHHYHWHLVYPFGGPEQIVRKDRRGEIFYYMHHQIMARYNAERLSNNLSLVTPIVQLHNPIPEAYFPKLDQRVASRAWPSRPKNMYLSDVDRPLEGLTYSLRDIETYRDRLLQAIQTRTVRDARGTPIFLDDFTGIDLLGSMVEASPLLSVNYAYYGNIHNFGHLAIACCHDPDFRYLEPIGIMADASTAMRDPTFYRWHQTIDNIFYIFKDSLTPYNSADLQFPGVKIAEIGIVSKGSNVNTLSTHWTKSDINLSGGLDFSPRGAILARIQHLDHKPFTYLITVNNSRDQDVWGTVRIFMAPKFNTNKAPFFFNDQRKLMIEMDKFTYKLKKGHNVIKRESVDSSVTIPYEATFRDLFKNRPNPQQDLNAYQEFIYCGCGWPQHMLIPKGSTNGFNMDLFVMISDYEKDRIDQAEPEGCKGGISYCGLYDRKYPDARSMGFPFDRAAPVLNLRQFQTPNMMSQTITVRFSDTVELK